MPQEIQIGQHKGTVRDYAITETKAGDPQVAIEFDVQFNDVTTTPPTPYVKLLTWRGSLKEGKALEITLRALATLRMKGNDPAILAEGVASAAISFGQEAMLDIQEEEYNGQFTKKIKWVNSVGGVGKRITAAEAKVKLANRNLAGQMAALKAKEGITDDIDF